MWKVFSISRVTKRSSGGSLFQWRSSCESILTARNALYCLNRVKDHFQYDTKDGEGKAGLAGNGHRSFSTGVSERSTIASTNDPTDKYKFSWNEPFEKETPASEISSVSEGFRGDSADSSTESKPMAAGRLGRLLIRLGPNESVTPMLQQWAEEGHSFPKNAIIVALTNLKRHRRYKQALELANYVKTGNLFEMDDFDHMYRLYFTGQTGSIEDVEKCFAEVPSKWLTELVYNQLMSCYIARGMIADAERMLEKLKASGKHLSALPFSQFLALYSNQREFDKALNLLSEMNARNIVPDTRTYNILMSMSHKQGNTDKVLGFYAAMTNAGVVADSFTQSLVIKAYTSSGMVEEAQLLADEMMKINPADRHLANDLLLTVYADLGKEQELKKLWKRMSSFTNLSARSYGVMIESLGKLGLIQEAEELATRAERKTGGLVARVYNAMMNVYARHGKMKAAEELLMRIQKDRLRPNAVTYRHLIEGYLKLDHMEKALEYLRLSRESLSFDHSKPWLASFLLVIENLAERGDVESAERTFETFTAEGPYRSTSIYNALLKAYVNAGKKTVNFVERMSKDGFEPDSETLELLEKIESSRKDASMS